MFESNCEDLNATEVEEFVWKKSKLAKGAVDRTLNYLVLPQDRGRKAPLNSAPPNRYESTDSYRAASFDRNQIRLQGVLGVVDTRSLTNFESCSCVSFNGTGTRLFVELSNRYRRSENRPAPCDDSMIS